MTITTNLGEVPGKVRSNTTSNNQSDRHRDGRQLRAVIWVAVDPEWERHAARCVEYCTRMGYELVGVVSAGAAGQWASIDRMLTEGRAEIVVAAQRDQLPPDRTPRIEVVAEHLDQRRLVPELRPERNRPQFLRRNRDPRNG